MSEPGTTAGPVGMNGHATDVPGDRAGVLVEAVADLVPDPGIVAGMLALAAHLRHEPPDGGVLARVRRAYDLSPFEFDVLLLAGLPEEAEVATEAFRHLHPRGEPFLTPALVAASLSLDPAARRWLRRALTVGPLVAHGLVTPVDAGPLPERGHRLADHLWDVLRGVSAWPRVLAPVEASLPVAPLDGPLLAVLDRTTGPGGAGPVVVLVTGPPTRPATELAARAAATLRAAGRAHVVLDAAVAVEHGPLASLHAVARGAVPIVRGVVPGRSAPEHPGPVVVCAPDPAPLGGDRRPLVTIDVGAPGLGERRSMWQRLLPELDGEADRLAGLVRLDPVRAAETAGDARATAAGAGRPVHVDDVLAGARRRSDRTLPLSVRRVVPVATWADLVTTAANEARLRDVVARMRVQVQVLEGWGFGGGRLLPGVRMLLSGPPGTGKTLAAEIVAGALGLELLVVDLAALVSKWLGETEKHIGEVFDAAERSQAVLFFDEADAIFGKRTEAGDAQSRWANLETAYLLGRIDRFDGVVTLATNLRSNIDDAFVRRLDVIVELDEPDEVERRTLWRLHLPADAPVAGDVDVDALAALYPVTGALIRNATAAAAFVAADEGSPITQDHLLRSMEREYQKTGRSFPGRPRARISHGTGGG